MLKRVAFGLALYFSTTLSGYAMSIFDAGKVCVFSEVKAQVLKEGKPLANVKVVRRASWQKEEIDEMITDENGNFSFPAIFHRSATKFLPVEIVIAQALRVEVDGKMLKIWSNSKRNADVNGELNGAPLNFICEITDSLAVYREFGSILRTNCKWEK